MQLSMPAAKHTWNHNSIFNHQVVKNVEALPGVQSASIVVGAPMSSQQIECSMVAEGRDLKNKPIAPDAAIRVITDNYFETMGIPLIQGRTFEPPDSIGTIGYTRNCVVSKTLADWCWPGENPIGQRFKVAERIEQWMTVVGVVGDVRYDGLDREQTADVYYPEKLFPQFITQLTVHTSLDPMELSAPVQKAILKADSDANISNVKTMENVLSESVGRRRFTMLLLSLFSAAPLFLSITGTYGVIAYSVSRRTREIGIRIALGAEPGSVVWQLARQHSGMIAVGVIAGATAAAAVSRHLASSLFQVEPLDVTVFIVVATILSIAGLTSCIFAARRAAYVDPMIALRCE